jgi:outer membrane biosynthesis protein TonB
LRYRELEYIQGDFRKRIAPFVILSCLLHVALVFYVLSLPSYQPLELAKRREPILVDYVENKEGTSPEPASLAPTVGADNPTPQAFQPTTPPLTAPQAPPPKQEERKAARVEKPKPEKVGVTTKKPKKAEKENTKVAKLVEPAPKPLPSARDLIPSMGDLMSWQTPQGNMYRSRFEQDGMGRDPAQVQYNAYLAILKQRVKQRWNVSYVTGVRREGRGCHKRFLSSDAASQGAVGREWSDTDSVHFSLYGQCPLFPDPMDRKQIMDRGMSLCSSSKWP